MIPTLFPSSNIQFMFLGKGKLSETISCVIHEELNGEYEMTLRYPLTGKRYSDLVAGGTIGAIAPVYTDEYSYYSREEEFFDIDRIAKPIDGIVEFKANHITRRLARTVFRDSTLPANDIRLAYIHSEPRDTGGIEVSARYSDFSPEGTVVVPQPKSTLAVFIGSENSLVSDIGGDFIFGSDLSVNQEPNYLRMSYSYVEHRGEDRGASIRFGVNMLTVDQEKDMTGAYNAVVPYWDDGSGNITYVTGYVVQPTTPITPVIAVPLDLSNDFETQPTNAQMVALARHHLDTKTPWTGSETIKVDFINGAEIDPHAPDIQLGDTVHVYWGDADIATDLRVVAYDYDVLAERYISLELGTPQTQYVAVTGDYAGASGGGSSGGGSASAEAVDFSSQCTFPKGGPAHFDAFALGGLAFISYQGPSVSNYAPQDTLVRVPEEYAFDYGTFREQHNLCSFNTAALGTVALGSNNGGRDIFINQKATTSGKVRCYFQICYPIKEN